MVSMEFLLKLNNGNLEWRIRTNSELERLYCEHGILVEIKKDAILRWSGHMQRMGRRPND